MEMVLAAEGFVRDSGLEPPSVLLLNLGESLTNGSFTTGALLLSSQFDSQHLDIRVELWEALAAPQKIVVIVSGKSCAKNAPFFNSEYG